MVISPWLARWSRSWMPASSSTRRVRRRATRPLAARVAALESRTLLASTLGVSAEAINTDTLSNFTVEAGDNRLLVVTVGDGDGTNTTAVTFNGQALTQAVERSDGFGSSEIWYLALGTSASATTANIVVTSLNFPPVSVIHAVAFQGIDQTTPVSGPQASSAAVPDSTLFVSSEPGDLVLDQFYAIEFEDTNAATPGTNQTVLQSELNLDAGGIKNAFFTSLKAGEAAATTGMSWDSDDDEHIHVAVNLNAAEVRVNTYTTGNQRIEFPLHGNKTTAMDADGDYVVVWNSAGQDGDSSGVYAQRYNAAGAAQGAEFRVNTYTAGAQSTHAVAMDADGDFVVVWSSLDGSEYNIYAQRYNALGVAQGAEFRVNSTTANSQDYPTVAMDADGDFVVAWTSSDGGGTGIFAQRYNALGVALGGEFRVNATTATSQLNAAVGMDATGDFVVAWSSAQDGNSFEVYAQRYNAAGVAQGTEFRVNTYITSLQADPSLALDADGDFVIAWHSDGQDGNGFGVYAQRYNAAGVAQGAEFRVNTNGTSEQASASVALDADGDFVISWHSYGQEGLNYGVYAQKYNAAGVAQGTEFRVNAYTTNDQRNASLAMDADGDFVVAWESDGQDGSGFGMYARLYQDVSDNAPPIVSDVLASGTPVPSAGRISNTGLSSLTVAFSEAMNTTGGTGGANSVTNPANWSLTFNGVNVSAQIASVTFGLNAATNKYEAVVTFTGLLSTGHYVLSALNTLQDATGNGLDGDFNGTAGGNFARAFQVVIPETSGEEFRVNTYTTADQRIDFFHGGGKTTAMDTDGDFVVVWNSPGQDGSGYGVYAQRYNAAGVAQGAEFRVNAYTTSSQTIPTVAMDADGDFVVIWSSNGQDGSGYGIYAQRYDALGVAQGSEFQVNTYTTGGQAFPSIAMDADGDFVVVWRSYSQDGNNDGIYAQRYNALGMAQGSEFRVNTYTTDLQDNASVAMNAGGDFVVVWSSVGQDGSSDGVYGQRYNAQGIAQGGEFQVNTYTTQTQRAPTVAVDADGDFVVIWQSSTQDGSGSGIFGQRYNALGVAQGSEFRVNTYTTLNQTNASVALDAGGNFIVTWQSNGQDGGSYGIYGQRYTALGVAKGSEFVVNTYTTARQSDASVAMDADGDFVIAWESDGQDGSGFGMYAQRYDVTAAAPTITPGQSFSIAENRPLNHVVGTVIATDANVGDTLTYAITGGNTGNAFAINASTGQITVNSVAAINFEVNPTFNLTVTVTDQTNLSDAETVTVNLTDLNEAPTFVAPTTFTIAENRSVGYFVGDVNAVDPEMQTLTYSIVGGDPNAQFAINAATGVITVNKATINYEATPQFVLQVKAQDNGSPSNFRTQNITVNITNLNEAPVFVAAGPFAIAENRSVGYFVGDVNAVDPDAGQTLTYSIVGGNPNAQFAINAASGVITVAKATINYEATPQFLLQVKAQDNGNPANSRTQNVTVNISNLNEAPVFTAAGPFTIAENRSVGTFVGDVNAVDQDAGQTLTYSITGGDPNAQFAINANTGVITVAKATINFEATPQFVLQVKAQDNGNPANFRTQNITVNITNLNEAPVFVAPVTFTIQENRPNGTVVGTVHAVDPENQTLTYSITGGNTNTAFAINGATGQLTVANSAALDFETTPQFVLQVKAQDNGSPANFKTQNITINLTDIAAARVPAPRPTPSFRLLTTPLTGQQAPVAATVDVAPKRPASASAATDLYSFTLFEPVSAAATVSEEN